MELCCLEISEIDEGRVGIDPLGEKMANTAEVVDDEVVNTVVVIDDEVVNTLVVVDDEVVDVVELVDGEGPVEEKDSAVESSGCSGFLFIESL
jgi:hypothetical protein